MRKKGDRKVVWTDTARQDLVGIGDFLSQVATVDKAASVVQRIIQAGQLLATHALLWRMRNEIFPGARMVIVRPFVLVYHVSATKAYIARVLHGHRNFREIFKV